MLYYVLLLFSIGLCCNPRSCTQLIACPLDQDTLHATLRLCLRFTRHHSLAEEFARQGGPQALLAKKQGSSFKGFSSLTVLLLRHVMESDATLSETMETVIRSVIANNRPRESSYSTGQRELHLVMRKLAPAACRNVELFKDTACTILRVNNKPARVDQQQPQQRSGTAQRIPSTLVHCTPPQQQKTESHNVLPVHSEVVNMLLDILCTLEEGTKVQHSALSLDSNQLLYDTHDTVHVQMGNVHVVGNERLSARAVSLTRDTTTNRSQRIPSLRSRPVEDDDDNTSEDMNVEYNSSQAASPERKDSKDMATTDEQQTEQPILSKAGLLRLLTELIDAYPNCCQVVSDSTRTILVNGNTKVR